MQIGFVLKRDSNLKVMGSLIVECQRSGHEVFLFYLPASVRGNKAYQQVTHEVLSLFYTPNTHLVETKMEMFGETVGQFPLDVLVTLEGFNSLSKASADLQSLRRRGIKVVSLGHFFETARWPIEALDAFDKTYYISEFVRDIHFRIVYGQARMDYGKGRHAHQYEIAGSPMFDQFHFRSPALANGDGGRSNTKAVLLMAPILSMETPWRYFVWKEGTRLGRIKSVVKSKKWEYLSDILRGPTFQTLVEDVREFCDRNDAKLIVKSRGKQDDPAYLKDYADIYIDGKDDIYYPLFTTYQLLSYCDLCITVMSMTALEAVSAGVPVLNVSVPHLDRAFLMVNNENRVREYFEAVHTIKDEGPFQYRDCVRSFEWTVFGKWLNGKSIEEFGMRAEDQMDYKSKFLGIEKKSSSARILESFAGF